VLSVINNNTLLTTELSCHEVYADTLHTKASVFTEALLVLQAW